MQVRGKIWKDGKFWVIHCESLQADTQGHSRKGALEMMLDWVRSMLDDPKFLIEIAMDGKDEFVLSFPEPKRIVALMLQRARNSADVTYEQIRRNLGAKSRTAYRQYESGKHDPGLSTLADLVNSVGYQLEINLIKKPA